MTEHQRARASRVEWVRIGDMMVSPKAQRDFKKSQSEGYAADFKLEALGYPVLSHRDDYYWILDGQHRIAALKMVGFTDDDQIECEVYEGLSEADEADLFLLRDKRRAINRFDAFRIAVTAGWVEECHIERLVQAEGLTISKNASAGSISAVTALRFAYDFGPRTFTRCLRILGRSYDNDRAAFSEHLIKGVALVCQRYDGSLDDEEAIRRLNALNGGPAAVMRKANALQLKTGHTKPHCVAAAIVDTLNARKGGKKLESWWR